MSLFSLLFRLAEAGCGPSAAVGPDPHRPRPPPRPGMADVVTAPARSRAQRLLEGPHPHAHPQEERIPIWTGPECKVLGGVSRATTCAEVVRLLVAPDEDPAQFVIVEKWRKVST